MLTDRPFRFGTGMPPAPSPEAWIAQARLAEELGYATVGAGGHPGVGEYFSPLPALMSIADATSHVRLSSLFANDFQNPVLLAMAASTLDFLSEGRLELGIGGGWLAEDYAISGIPFDPPSVRIDRLSEAVTLIKRLFNGGPVTFTGDHYQVKEASLLLKPAQRPYPPLFIGGGGRRVLSLAAREADIVGLDPKATVTGAKDLATSTAEAVDQQVAWVREAAGTRFSDLELHINVLTVIVTEDRQRAAEDVAKTLATLPPSLVANPLSADQILDWPQALIGSVEQIVEVLQARRERYGISYVGIPGESMEAFSPVVARLHGR